MARSDNEATVKAFWTAMGKRDIEGYLAVFAEGAVAYDPVNKPPARTQAERRAFMQGVFDGFARIDASIDFMTHCGDHTATKWTVLGVTPGGDKVTIEGVDVVRHDDSGKIVELWGYFDN